MQRLSGTDVLFLAMEQPAWHQHVGGLTVLDASDAPDYGFDTVVAVMEERIRHAPKYTWKLREVPFGLGLPVWVRDPDFDVRNHVHYARVPRPGRRRQLAQLTGEILSVQLDRRRPLWELWYLDGLADGTVATVMKYHHCLQDGVAGSALATVMMDTEPCPPTRDAPPPDPLDLDPDEPGELDLLARSALGLLATPVRLGRYAGGLARRAARLAAIARDERPPLHLGTIPRTRWNGPIGPQRSFAFASVSLDDVKDVRRHFGTTVNDVVLAMCGGALRRYLIGLDELPERSLVTGVPVSTRAAGDTTMDNQITTVTVTLGTDITDAGDRLRAVAAEMAAAKRRVETLSSVPLPSLGELAPPMVFSGTFGLFHTLGVLSRIPLAMNTIVSNVPGPPFPLYSAGAKVVGIYSTSVIVEGVGLNITLFSYLDRIDFGVHVDPALVPDPWAIADELPRALAELKTAGGLGRLRRSRPG